MLERLIGAWKFFKRFRTDCVGTMLNFKLGCKLLAQSVRLLPETRSWSLPTWQGTPATTPSPPPRPRGPAPANPLAAPPNHQAVPDLSCSVPSCWNAFPTLSTLQTRTCHVLCRGLASPCTHAGLHVLSLEPTRVRWSWRTRPSMRKGTEFPNLGGSLFLPTEASPGPSRLF